MSSSGRIVAKQWGSERIVLNEREGGYCLKEMRLTPNKRCSIHHHAVKDETFVVDEGWLHVLLDGERRTLRPGESIRIKPGQKHSFWSHVHTAFREVSTFDSPEDSIREDRSQGVDAEWKSAWPQWPGQFKVLVVGDVMLDEAFSVKIRGASAEAPGSVMRYERWPIYMPGGAANVATLLADMGTRVTLIGVVGSDSEGDVLRGRCQEHGIQTMFCKRPGVTTLKTRHYAGFQQVYRADRDRVPDPEDSRCVADILDGSDFDRPDLIIVSDYNKGALGPHGAKVWSVLDRLQDRSVIILDPSVTWLAKAMQGDSAFAPDYLKPNADELNRAATIAGIHASSPHEQARALFRANACNEAIIVTRGEHGCMVYQPLIHVAKDSHLHVTPTSKGIPPDTCGAGDEFCAVLGLEMLAGRSVETACNVATNWSTRRVGLGWSRRLARP